MSRQSTLFVALAILLVLPETARVAAAQAPNDGSAAAATADSLLHTGDLRKSFTVLTERLGAAPDDIEARWRATRVALGLGISATTDDERRTWLRTADQQGRELLRLQSLSPDEMAWAAAARGQHALAETGPRTVARLAKETWLLTGQILAVDPRNALANDVRGRLCLEVARMPAIARFFGRLFLGNSLVNQAGQWPLAEQLLRQAIASDSGLVVAWRDLGEVYESQKKWKAAEDVYRQGVAVPPRYVVDTLFTKAMRERLAALRSSTSTW